MTNSWEKHQADNLAEVWQFKQPELTLIAGIELILESIFNPGFSLLCVPSESISESYWNPRWLELAFFPKSDQEFITTVWNTETCGLAYKRVISIFNLCY